MAVSVGKRFNRSATVGALGVVVVSLAIPFALDGHWSAAIWAFEGAVVVWVGVRRKRLLARHLGLLLQLAAGFIFVDSVFYPFTSLPFANYYFLGCLVLSLAALFSSYCLDRYRRELKKWERYFPLPLMITGLIWWYIGGLREVYMQISHAELGNGFLMLFCASSILMGMAVKKMHWPRFRLSMHLQLPAMILLAAINFESFAPGLHFFKGWGTVAWTVAFFIQYRILYLFTAAWPKGSMVAWHLGTICLLFFVLYRDAWGMSAMSGQTGTLEKLMLWIVLVSGLGLFILITRNLIKQTKPAEEKRVSGDR